MPVVALVGAVVSELHRDAEAVAVLRAHLGQDLELLDAGNRRELLGRCEKVELGGRSGGMREREDDAVANAARLHPGKTTPTTLDR